jgi:hypothetical protein
MVDVDGERSDGEKRKSPVESDVVGEQGEKQVCGKAVPDDFEPPPSILGIRRDNSDDSEDDCETQVARTEMERDFAFLDMKEKFVGQGAGNTRRVILTIRQLRRVMVAKESLFKFGTFIPRSEREADAAPEVPRSPVASGARPGLAQVEGAEHV